MTSRLTFAAATALVALAVMPLAAASATPALTITSPSTGSSSKEAAPLFVGATSDSADAVTVTITGLTPGSTPSASTEPVMPTSGVWSVSSTALADGTYTAIAQQSETGSLEPPGFSLPVTFTIDTLAPSVSLNAFVTPMKDATPEFSGSASTAPGDENVVSVSVYAGSAVGGPLIATEQPSVNVAGGWSYMPPLLPDGTYTVGVSQEDEAGNVSATASATFTVDTVAPAVSLGVVAPLTNNSTPSFGGVAGVVTGASPDAATVAVVVHKGSSIAGSIVAEGNVAVGASAWSYTTSPALADGTYTVQAIQRDQAGNEGKSSPATFRIDTVAPVLSVGGPKVGETLKSSKVVFEGTTNNGSGEPEEVAVEIFTGSSASGTAQTLEVKRSGSSWTTAGESLRLANNTYTVRAREHDAAGNLGESAAVTFSVESPAPIVTLNALPSFTNNSAPSFSGGAATSEAKPEVTLKIWSGHSASGTLAQAPMKVSAGSGAWAANAATLADGTYTAQAEQPAEASNPAGVSEARTFTVDTAAPAPTITGPGESSGTEILSGLAGEADGDRPQITVELFTGATAEPGQDFETIMVKASKGKWSFTFAGLAGGEYTAIARQSDEAGNAGQSPPSRFTVTASPTLQRPDNPGNGDATPAAASPPTPGSPSPPSASFTWVPANPAVGQSVSLVSSSTGASSPIGAFAWDVAGSGAFAAGGPSMTTSFAMAGAHLVRLRVTDGNGLSSIAAQTIVVSTPPLRLMQPFPIVRIAGSETSNGAKLRLLTVQAPLATQVVITCKGQGCKTKSESRVATASSKGKGNAGSVMLSFHRFERSLRVGDSLQIRVTKAGEIGKYTSFTVRRNKLPLRVDACLRPTSPKPIACPAS